MQKLYIGLLVVLTVVAVCLGHGPECDLSNCRECPEIWCPPDTILGPNRACQCCPSCVIPIGGCCPYYDERPDSGDVDCIYDSVCCDGICLEECPKLTTQAATMTTAAATIPTATPTTTTVAATTTTAAPTTTTAAPTTTTAAPTTTKAATTPTTAAVTATTAAATATTAAAITTTTAPTTTEEPSSTHYHGYDDHDDFHDDDHEPLLDLDLAAWLGL
ncbi:unnamed protein product [Ceutorhynchus assimilis]|uniref:Uncharacterized protein n=1 Tax=Ceutorhynchus assimilis TaxID=467358 RepID=A0A9N9QS28_9CUCU|nr:unnamed protein product [Ceutorhynchus assimilis]